MVLKEATIGTAGTTNTTGTSSSSSSSSSVPPDSPTPQLVIYTINITLYVTHLETGTILASNEKYCKQQQQLQNNNNGDTIGKNDTDNTSSSINEHTIRLFYGQYDGGGTISVAMSSLVGNIQSRSGSGAVVAEGQRPGGVGIYQYDTTSNDLMYQGSIYLLNNCIATSFDNDNNLLCIATDNGYIVAYSTDSTNDDDDDDNNCIFQLPPLVGEQKNKI
jgi:hypothetical protein